MRLTRLLGIAILLSCSMSIHAQSDWEKIAPVGHSFIVLMPTKAVSSSRQISTSDSESVSILTYQSVLGGKRYIVGGFYKSATNVPLLSSFDSFIKGLEHSFRTSAGPDSLKLDRAVTVEEAEGRQYHLLLGKLAGVARMLNSRTEYYVLIAIGGDETDPDVARFFSSFRTGEVNTNEESSGVTGRGGVITMVGSSSGRDASQQAAADSGGMTRDAVGDDNELPPNPWPRSNGKITGGVLNGKAIHLVQPDYPASARKNHDSGQIQVQVLIDEVGRVTKARALSGPESLREASVAAALKCQFTSTLLVGQPVKVNGVIIYNFVAQ